MVAFNIVKFKVKSGQDEAFLEAHRHGKANWPGLVRCNIVKLGDRSYCLIGEWPDMETMAAARPNMIATLDTFRAVLDDLGDGRGVTDASSGEVVLMVR